MKNAKFKDVINERTLRDFEAVASSFYREEGEPIEVKPQRDPRGKKERDMRKLSKKDRWDD